MLMLKDFKNDFEDVPVLPPGKDPQLIIPSPLESRTVSDPIVCPELQVLIVEDNSADAYMLRVILEATGMPTKLTLVVDGESAIQIMKGASMGQLPAPDLVLLDINLPGKNGHEVLASIRRMDRVAHTRVVICSGSNADEDVRQASDNGANAFLVKPMGLKEMDEMVATLRSILVGLNEEAIAAKCSEKNLPNQDHGSKKWKEPYSA
jgi:CheY-like chemotaxis protein